MRYIIFPVRVPIDLTLLGTLWILTVILAPRQPLAAERGNLLYRVSVAGGIVSPSYSTAVFENPAAVIFIPKLNGFLQGMLDFSSTPAVGRAGLGYGSGSAGVIAGGSYSPTAGGFSSFYGAGLDIPKLKTSFGMSGWSKISGAPTSGPVGTVHYNNATLNNTTILNAGALFSLNQTLNVGFTVIGFSTNAMEMGGGLEYQFGPSFSVVLDAAVSNTFQILGFEPGIKIGNEFGMLSASYGLSSGSVQLHNGTGMLGVGFRVGNQKELQVYYNRFSTIFVSLSIEGL